MPEVRLTGGPLDGLDLHYVRAGRGPAVVLVHGLGGFAEAWRRNLEPLAARATVIALDLPGFGRSAKPRVGYDLGYFAAAVEGLLDALGLGQVALVGHSLGGAVAMTLALTRPARVERLALVAGLVPGCYSLSRAYRLGALPVLGDLLALVRCARLYKAALARCFHTPDPAMIDFLVEHAYAERTGWAARAAFLAALRHCRADLVDRARAYRQALATLDVPVLLLHGRQDPVVPAACCREAAAILPRSQVRWIDACGHFPQIEHADAVNAWLGEFVAGHPAPR